jgi:large subunit ribosomal protein L6
MSRIGQKPIEIPAGVTVTVAERLVTVKGPKGELSRDVPEQLEVAVTDGKVIVTRNGEGRTERSFQGLIRSLVANMIEGVNKGFSRELEIEGVGFRAAVQGRKVVMALGFANPKEFELPDGVTVTEEGGTRLTVSGIDKQKVGDAAAQIRSFYPAEPYKGKGLRYKGERVRRKVGKTVA